MHDAVIHGYALQRQPGPGAAGSLPLLRSSERAALAEGAWFAALPATVRHDLLRRCRVRRYRHDEPVHAGTASCMRLDAVASGVVGVAMRNSGGVFQYLPAGTWLVDPAMFGGGERRHTIVAHGKTTIVSVDGELLAEEMGRHFGLEQALLTLSHDTLAMQCQVLDELSDSDIRTRLLRCLRRLGAAFGEIEEGGLRIALDLKQDALATMLRASRARVNLHLKALEREGVLVVGRQMLIRDLHRLGEPVGTMHA